MRVFMMLLFLSVAACSHSVPPPTVEGGAIKEVDDGFRLRHCERVGPISARYGGADLNSNRIIARRMLVNKAGLSKATHISDVVPFGLGDECGPRCIEVQAIAFRCPPKVVDIQPSLNELRDVPKSPPR